MEQTNGKKNKFFVKLTDKQLELKKEFIKNYSSKSNNAADGSSFDANANITNKNMHTMEYEIHKDINIQINRALICDKITELYGEDLAKEYIRQIEDHEIYIHDETSLKPYCTSITMYPFLLNGLKTLGGGSVAPKHLASFCGGFINLMLAVSSQFAGAVATVEFLMYFDYFAKKTYGENYLETNTKDIDAHLQHVVYTINQPSVSRGYQSIFWNISIYDRPYFEAMFGDFAFPDWSRPSYESLNKLQKHFMKWFNKERCSALLTYPVITAACLTKNGELVDKDFEDFITEEYAEGNGFFTFMSDNACALSSCCRLKNNIEDQRKEFSYTLGAGGVSTGSLNVITINLNRAVQKGLDIREMVQKIHKYQIATRKLMEQYLAAGLMPVYDAGYITMDRQYLTIGINGMVEAAESQGLDIGLNEDYMSFVENILKTISDENKKATIETGYKFNTEFVPAENLGVKNARWDKEDGLKSERDCYNSYLYKVEDEDISILDKFQMHGKRFMQYLDGGSAYHCNLSEYPTQEGFKKLLKVAATEGCEYFCFNILVTCCNSCGYIDKHTLNECSQCHSENVEHATRIIGYLKTISSWSKERREEHARRAYSPQKNAVGVIKVQKLCKGEC